MNEHGRGLGATAEASDKGSEGWKTDEWHACWAGHRG